MGSNKEEEFSLYMEHTNLPCDETLLDAFNKGWDSAIRCLKYVGVEIPDNVFDPVRPIVIIPSNLEDGYDPDETNGMDEQGE